VAGRLDVPVPELRQLPGATDYFGNPQEGRIAMTQEVRAPSRIAEARAIAARLERATESMNERLKVAEKAIADMRINVPAEVEMLPEEDVKFGLSMRLAFGRDEGRWGLYIVTNSGSTPLLKSSRHARIEAAKHLGALIEAIIREAEQWSADLVEAEQAANAAIDLALKGARAFVEKYEPETVTTRVTKPDEHAPEVESHLQGPVRDE
jgi:hypothetical protein